MEGKEFFALAQKLAQMRTEPALRSAVSRAYYGAYHCCIQLLREFGFQFSKDASAHEIEKHSQEPLRAQLRDGLRVYHAKINP
jgi:uncharacterized protein (UPF0332 family)